MRKLLVVSLPPVTTTLGPRSSSCRVLLRVTVTTQSWCRGSENVPIQAVQGLVVDLGQVRGGWTRKRSRSP